jgi:hypothetical protein
MMSCQHLVCRCQEVAIERLGLKFCSEACADLETTGSQSSHCTCGHVDCAAD